MALRTETSSEFPHNSITLLSSADVIRLMDDKSLDAATVEQLYDFGKVLLDQIRDLRETYDEKLTSCLGWSSALFALVMVGTENWMKIQGPIGLFASFGVVFAFASLIAAMLGLRSRGGWKWPSEKDWFSEEFLKWPTELKKQHIIVMHQAHRSYSELGQRKGHFLIAAEWGLILAALCLGLAVIAKAWA